ncbi:MAG: hypothetical protein IPJ65_09170 [Archangiaceae bacterium]|nr:hypothetical protein [Archangiaceae bacterium]
MNRTLSALALVVVLTGCSGPGGGGTGGGTGGAGGGTGGAGGGGNGGPIPLSQVCDALGNLYCQRFAQCGLVSSLSNCLSLFAAQGGFGNCLGASADALDAGRVRYDPAAAGQCFAAITNLPCPTGISDDSIGACQSTIVGTVGSGQICFDSQECQPNLWCKIPQGVCGGTCLTRTADGQAPGGNECMRLSYEYEGTCHRPVDGGASCAQSDGGFAVTQNCVDGYYCDRTSHHCEAFKAHDAPCNPRSSNECGFAVGCFGPLDGGFCRAPHTVGQDCVTVNCQGDTWCKPELDGGRFCQAWSAMGGSCKDNSSCAPPARCAGTDGGTFGFGTCQPLGGTGIACSGSSDCATGLHCGGRTRVCEAAFVDGAACQGDNECQSRFCVGPVDGGPSVCRPDPRCY